MEQRNLRDRDGQVVVPPDRALSRGGRGSSSGRPTPTHQHPAKHRSPTSYQPRHLVIIITTIILSVVLTTPSSASKPLSYSSIGDHAPSSGTSGDEGQGRDARRCNTRSTGHPLPPHQLPTEHSQLQIYQQHTTSLMAIVVTSPALPSHSVINANDLGWPPSGGGNDVQGRRWPCLRPAAGPRPAYQHIILPALLTYNGMNACDLCQALDHSGSYNARYQTESSLSPPRPWPKYLHINVTCMNGSVEPSQGSLQESWSYDCILHKESAIQKYSKVAHTGKSSCTNEQFPYQSKDKSTVHYKDNTKCVINPIIRI